MPSFSKKNPNSTAFSKSDAATPSHSYSNPNPSYNDEHLLLLDEISTDYPSFIGTSALICRLIEDASESKGCKVWLSESAMIASSITPGSIVSVSLASLKKDVSDYPLSSLADECARHYMFNEKINKESGNYFILATAFPSCKITKNGVRLSSPLSSTMGYPDSGRIVFVYPLNLENNTSISMYKCKDLHLSLISSKSSISTKSNKKSQLDSRSENGNIPSPKTPSLTRSKLSSPCSSQPTSPRHRKAQIDPNSNSCNIRQVLDDETSKKLLETCTMPLLYSRYLLCGNLVVIPFLSELCLFKVISAEKVSKNSNIERNNGSFLVDTETKIHLFYEKSNFDLSSEDIIDSKTNDIPKLGGLSKEYEILKDIIVSSTINNTLSRLGFRPPMGVLLYGPPGTGKTSLARLCAKDAGIKLFSVKDEFFGKAYAKCDYDKAIKVVFESARSAAPAVVLIDDLDDIAPPRKEGGEELSGRNVATLLNMMDGIIRTEGVFVIATTNQPDSIEPALRRPGRINREIKIGVPSPKQRYEILNTILQRKPHHLLDNEIHDLAMTTHGFVGADLASLCNKADSIRHMRDIGKTNNKSCISDNKTEEYSFRNNTEGSCLSNSEVNLESDLSLSLEDFEKARIKVRPTAMREVMLEIPKVSWEDVGGQEEVKMQLREAVIWPQKHKEALKRIGTRAPTGVLLFGPPGCSKTLLARAVASEAKLNFLAIKGPELLSKWVGESEKAVKSVFARARANAPSILFFDEFDALASIRGTENDGVSVADRVTSELLVELDGLNKRVDVTVIAATNRPDKIDPAVLRPGRFDRLVYVGPPNEKDRKEIFRVHLRKMSCSSDVCIEDLARVCEGYTGADIALLCQEAGVAAIKEKFEDAMEVRMDHFRIAFETIQPSDVESCEELTNQFQRLVSIATPEDDFVPQENWAPFLVAKLYSLIHLIWFLVGKLCPLIQTPVKPKLGETCSKMAQLGQF